MESQEMLNLETGTKEAISLKPMKVKIVEVDIKEVGEKGNKKVACLVMHPDKKDIPISISAVKYEKSKDKLEVSGLWFNLDEDNLIRKGSALASFLAFVGVKTPNELKEKEVDTTEDDKGYLCFKAY